LETVMGLAEKIKSLRYAKGWGPGKLAEVAGLSRTEIYQIEEGNRIEPRASTTKRLADALGVSVAELTEIEPFPLQANSPSEVDAAVRIMPLRIVER
jgi:transcriptional regulator with XRE-family HTH domain